MSGAAVETTAVVSRSVDDALSVERVLVDPPGPGEVRIEVKATAICHSDLAYLGGQWGDFPPSVFGHETAGIVAAVGEGITDLAVGMPVVATLIRSCGSCFFCERGEPTFCVGGFALDDETRLRSVDGSPIAQGFKVGGFAGQVVVHRSQAIAVDPALSLEEASLVACGVLTGIGAVRRSAGVETGASVVVVGAGGVGLNTIQGARIAGADPIVAVDLAPAKLAASIRLGATAAVQPADAAEAVARLTDGRGADYVFVAAGSGRAIDSGMDLVRRGGSLVVVGMPPSGVVTELELGNLAAAGRRIIGSKMGSAIPAVDVPDMVSLALAGQLELESLITHRLPIEEVGVAVGEVLEGTALRNLIVF